MTICPASSIASVVVSVGLVVVDPNVMFFNVFD